jgi:hypothetical protein
MRHSAHTRTTTQVCDVLTHINAVSGAASKMLHVRFSMPTTFFCMVRDRTGG